MPLPFQLRCQPPFLIATFREPQQMLSWSVTLPGLRTAQRVAWLEVSNKDLPKEVDAVRYVVSRMADAGLSDAITLITSRNIRRHHLAQQVVEGFTATCLTTVMAEPFA